VKRAVVLILAVLGFVGCQSQPRRYWFNPEKTLEEATQDCRQCNRHASARAQEEHIGRYQDSMERGRPWQMGSAAAEEANREMDEAYFFGTCMTSRGYRLVPESRLGAETRKRTCFGGDGLQPLAGE
jgi:hypothetical protein